MLDPQPRVYLTNLNDAQEAWQADSASIADLDLVDFDGMIQISVWRRSFRVFRWRNGAPIDRGHRFLIKERQG